MSLYDDVRELPLSIESYELELLSLQARPEFLRKTTLVRLRGGGEEGVGEDVTYHGEEHDRLQERGPDLPLAGSWTLHSFSEHLATLPLFDAEPAQHAYYDYRRWGFESAALDLALRQAGTSLGAALGREARPVSFVVSGGLGDPPSTARFREWLALYPGLRFKLDANSAWTEELIAELAESGAIDSIDFKGQYRGTTVDTPPDPVLYRRVAEGLPDAWLEDPGLTDETVPVLEPHRDRVTWDAIIHSVEDIEALPWTAAHRQRQAVTVRLRRTPLRSLRLLRGERHRRVRRWAVGARHRPRTHPAPRCAEPSGDAERRRAARVQPRPAARAPVEPAHGPPARDRASRRSDDPYLTLPARSPWTK